MTQTHGAPVPLPIEDQEAAKLAIDIATQLVTSTVVDGQFTIHPDEAIRAAATMIGYAFSQDVLGRVRRAFMDPATVADAIDKLMKLVSNRTHTQQLATADRSAQLYAAAFGIKRA